MALSVVTTLAGCAAPQARVTALAETLARHASATAALEEWCRHNRFADAPRIAAHRLPATGETVAEARQHLRLSADAPLGIRHVELVCGTRVLSVAHNVYDPALLTRAMNAALAGSDIPFGKVVAPLGFTRETLDTRRGGEPGCPAGTVLSQVALLRLPGGRPLAFLTECYTRAAVE